MKISTNQVLLLAAILFTSCTGKKQNTPSEDARNVSTEISNQHVTAFAEDSHGQIWIGTARGLNKYVGNTYYQYSDDIRYTHHEFCAAAHCDIRRHHVVT
jgi:hypothetical protein